MESQNPEDRIAELERQLADANRTVEPHTGSGPPPPGMPPPGMPPPGMPPPGMPPPPGSGMPPIPTQSYSPNGYPAGTFGSPFGGEPTSYGFVSSRSRWGSGSRVWRRVGTGFFGAVVVAIALVTHFAHSSHFASRTSSTTALSTTTPPPPQLLTGDGLTGLLAGMRTKFGDTMGYSLDVESNRAGLSRPDSANARKIDRWFYDSTGWNNDADESSNRPPVEFEIFPWDDTAVGDLSRFDVQAVLGVVRAAPKTLHIDSPTDTTLWVDSLKDGSLGLRVQVTDDNHDTGTVVLSPDGTVSKVEPPS